MFSSSNIRWVTIRVDLAGTLLVTALAVWLMYFAPLSASNTGFSLAMAGTSCYHSLKHDLSFSSASFSNNILNWVRVFNDLETSGMLPGTQMSVSFLLTSSFRKQLGAHSTVPSC